MSKRWESEGTRRKGGSPDPCGALVLDFACLEREAYAKSYIILGR